MGAMDNNSLASDFPAATEAEWRVLVDKALAGAPFESLRTQLYEGFETEPLYAARDGSPSLGAGRGWRIVQPLRGGALQDAAEAKLANDLSGGDCAYWLDFDGALKVQNAEQLKSLLSADAPYYVAAGSSIASVALVIAALEKNSELARATGSTGFDPLSTVAISGEIPADRSSLFADYVDAAFWLREHAPSFVPFLASGHAWNMAGGSAVQELAFTLAAGVSYWRALSEAGMPVNESSRSVGFSLTASADIFLTIATFRAMRLLWSKALAAANAKPAPDMLLLAQMSPRILTAYDPHVNLLRGTAAAFGAAIGGANGIQLLPFDEMSGGATPFSRRLAHNTNLILQHESHIASVADAAAGSYYVENLTNELAKRAWEIFRQVEAKGGLAAAIESGFVQAELRRTAEEREGAVARRKEKIIGVSVFPNLAGTFPSAATKSPPARPHSEPASSALSLPQPGKGERFSALVAAARHGARLSELRIAAKTVTDFAGPRLASSKRDAEPFEVLRRQSDLALANVGSRPPIFLALLGKPEDYRPRESWVRGFFATGGIETVAAEHGFDNVEALVAAFRRSPAPAACLCSSNAGYGAMAGAAAALKKAGAVFVYLAGPAAILNRLDPRDANAIDRLVYEGCDVIALLREAHKVLRVEDLSAVADEDGDDT